MIEMPEVERNPNNEDYIKTLYEMDVVLFEHCILIVYVTVQSKMSMMLYCKTI